LGYAFEHRSARLTSKYLGGMYGAFGGGIVLSVIGRDSLPVAGHIIRRCDWFGYGSFFDRQNRKLIPAANEPSTVLHVPLGCAPYGRVRILDIGRLAAFTAGQ
jgi:hypothetical protein